MVVKSELAYRIRRVVEDAGIDLFVGIEGSVALSDHDLPEPDILLTSAPDGDGPVPCDSVALIVEVADTTLAFDLGRKLQMYAAAGVPEYWVVDIDADSIHQMWSPTEGEYSGRREVAFAACVEAATIPGLRLATAGL